MSKNKFIICGNHIGNVNALSEVAIEALRYTKYIICDTKRRLIKEVFTPFNIDYSNKEIVEFNDLNNSRVPLIDFALKNIKNGDVLFIADNGMPSISDWGDLLVDEIYSKGIDILLLPGPSIVPSALAVSGISPKVDGFMYIGLMDKESISIKDYLNSALTLKLVMVITDYPNEIINTLSLIKEVRGDIFATVCINIGMPSQKILRGNISSLIKEYSSISDHNIFVTLVIGS